MLSYFLRRLAVALGLVWVIVTLVFLIIHMIPGDPVEMLLSQGGVPADPGLVEEMREQMGLNRPLLDQYWAFLVELSRGGLGKSMIDEHSVVDEVALRLPRTLELIGAAGLISFLIGVPLGALAALRRGKLTDRLLSTVSGALISTPVFVTGTLVILILAQQLRLIPAGGYVPFAQDPLKHLGMLLLPAGTIALGLSSIVLRMTRSAVLEVLARDFIRAAHAKGLAPQRILWLHAVRNALVPVVTVFALQLGTMLGGTVLIEYVFNWPGLSGYLVRAVDARDYPEVTGIVLVVSVLFVMLNLLVDLLYAALDPRVRHG
ncbi:ABC transporter permease [Acetobacteraceae bacterium H6797]|nr:ABC transporter permease [Acetobacteraceae bacterium H6797]